jgi:hypothetical protein
MIDDLIREGVAATRLNEAQVRTALAGVLALLGKHAERGKLQELFAAVPGAEALAGSGQALLGKPGLMGGLMKGVGGAGGAAAADALAMQSRLGKEGVARADLEALLPVATRFVKTRSGGRNLLKEVAASVPALGPLLAKS